MHVLKKTELAAYSVSLALLLALLCVTVLAENQKGIIIRQASGLIVNGAYRIDADIDYHLGEESEKALLHGVSLQIDVELRLKMKRPWLWNKTIEESVISYRLEHYPLSGQYLVTNLTTGNREQFRNLPGALDYMGKISNFPLVAENRLQEDRTYLVQVRARLNRQALPAPLRPLAYLSSRWNVSSPTHEWTLQ